MFRYLLLSAFTVMHLYVFWRAGSASFLHCRLSRKALVVAGAVLWSLFLFGRVLGRANAGFPAEVLELAGMTWMGVVFLVAVPMLAVDALTGFGRVMPGTAHRLRGAAVILGLMLSAVALIQGIRQPVLENYEVRLPGLPPMLDGTVIVGLSDLHLGSQRKERWLRELVSRVQAGKPDVIMLLGDIFEGHGTPPGELAAALGELRAPLGVWAVLGNHELHGSNDGNGVVSLFRQAGITVLRNQRVPVRPGLSLAGVDDLTSNHRAGSNADLITRTLSEPLPGATILLSHTPWNADRAEQSGAGLMLCGHTHGGQIWPFGHIVKMVYPLVAGRYDVEGMTIIVSRGAGTWATPMRLWQPGEIVRVTLRATKMKRKALVRSKTVVPEMPAIADSVSRT